MVNEKGSVKKGIGGMTQSTRELAKIVEATMDRITAAAIKAAGELCDKCGVQ